VIDRPKTGQRGFSLLEVLVAFSIMAMSLGFIYKAMGSNARSVGDLALRQQATMLAESVLLTKDSVSATGWNESGSWGVYGWRVSSQPFVQSAQLAESADWLPLHQIRIDVSWPEGSKNRQLEVKTLLPQRKPLPGESVQ
jgi:general secretion pathway protein I